jgi:hypothetical protein
MIGIYCRDGSNSRCLDVPLYTFFTDRMSHSQPPCYSCSPSRLVPINLPAAVLFSLAAGGGSRNFLGRIEAVATSIRLRSAVAIYCPPGSRRTSMGQLIDQCGLGLGLLGRRGSCRHGSYNMMSLDSILGSWWVL